MFDKVLKESILADPSKGQPFLDSLVSRFDAQLFMRKFREAAMRRKVLKEAEGTLQGAVDTETDATSALGEVYRQIIMGVEEHHPLDFARIYQTDKMQLLVPVGTHGVATKRAAGGTFTAGEKTQSPVTITLDQEFGLDTSWTKAHLEDASWDVLAEQTQNAGYAVQHKLCERLLRRIQHIDAASLASAAHVAIANQSAITMAEFTAMLAAVDIQGTGPPDYVLVSPKKYWQLLSLTEFVSSLYAGSDEVMRTGIAKTMFGVTVVRISDMGMITQAKYDGGAVADLVKDEAFTGTVQGASTGFILADSCISGTFGGSNKTGLVTCLVSTGALVDNQLLTGTGTGTVLVNGNPGAWSDIIALNSKKALALVYRRNIEIEPFQYPDQNRYGFTTSVRAKTGAVVPSAIAVGLCTAA